MPLNIITPHQGDSTVFKKQHYFVEEALQDNRGKMAERNKNKNETDFPVPGMV